VLGNGTLDSRALSSTRPSIRLGPSLELLLVEGLRVAIVNETILPDFGSANIETLPDLRVKDILRIPDIRLILERAVID